MADRHGRLLPPHDPGRLPGALRAGRGVPDRRREGRSAPVPPTSSPSSAPGVTVHESLAAADQLAADGIAARVVDCYSVKPIDQTTLVAACQATGGRIVVTEDHYPAGGLGEARAQRARRGAVSRRVFTHLAVAGLSQSGTPAELLDAAGISAAHIAKAARALLDE